MADKGTTAGGPAEETSSTTASSGRSRRRPSVSMRGVRNGSAFVRNKLAGVVWTVAALCAAVLAIAALLVTFEANRDNVVYLWFTDTAGTLAGPLDSLFAADTEARETLVNWGIAALAYLVVGKILQRIVSA